MWQSARGFLLAGILIAATVPASLAQRPGGGGPPPGGGMPGGPPGGAGPPGGGFPEGTRSIGGIGDTRDVSPSNGPSQSSINTPRDGLRLGPPGRWWDDKHFAKSLHLRPEQKQRMDTLFDENRANLVSHYQALQQEEGKMEDLAHAQTLDEKALFAQIDRVEQARAELEKANTHLMLQLRREMDADQISRLEAAH